MNTFHRRHVLSMALIATAVLLQTGCNSDHSSPQAVFSAAKSATKAKNYRKLVSLMDPDSQDQMASGMIMVATNMKLMSKTMSGLRGLTGQSGGKSEELTEVFAEVDKVLAKHGVTEEKMKELGDSSDKVGDLIKNKPAFIADMIKVFKAVQAAQPASGKMMQDPPELGELSDVEIDGDSAKGTMTVNGAPSPMSFKKVDGKWYISGGF